MEGSEPVFAFIFDQSVELSRWEIVRSTGPSFLIDSGMTKVAKNSIRYFDVFGGGTYVPFRSS